MQDTRAIPHNAPRESRNFKFSKFSQLRVPALRKRRVSVTRTGAWNAYPSNHGTQPKPSPNRYLTGSVPSMATATATATATPTTPQYASTTSRAATSGKAAATLSPIYDFDFPESAVTVERDEMWVQQLEEEQRKRFDTQARMMYKEYLDALEDAGPFATAEDRGGLLRHYEDRLEQMRQMQQEELQAHIEMEHQERLWSMGQQDPKWDGWRRVYEEQVNILAKIKRDAQQSNGIGGIGERSKEEMIKENQQEGEDILRKSEEFQRFESQRAKDRQQWAERTRISNFNLGERRQRDLAEAKAYEALQRAREAQSARLRDEARQGAAQLRARASQAALNTEFETRRQPPATSPISETSSRTSLDDGIFSSSPTATDTAASSVFGDRSRPSNATPFRPSAPRTTPIPVPVSENIRRSASGTFGGSPPSSRPRPTGTSTPSSLSGTPTSGTMAYAKGEDPPLRWIPPETAREPTRKGSMLFGASPAPSPSPTLEEPSRRAQTQQPRSGLSSQPQPPSSNPSAETRPHPQAQTQQFRATPSPQPPSQTPNAPGVRPQPLPQTQSQYGSTPTPQPRQNTSFSSQPPLSSYSASFSDTNRREGDARPGRSTSYSVPPSNMGPKAASSPTNAGTRSAPPPTKPSASGDDYRSKLRAEYVKDQERRIDEERRRREEEANERRAEDARRRGAEKRRQEEQAREAERREAERKARKASNPNMRPAPDQSILEVWTAYESHWAAMATASQLRFRSIPWPVLNPVSSPEMLLPIHIAAFILSPQHSQGKSRKDRLKDALLRWHPDRFETKWLKKVVDEERETVKEGVGLVVRALNDLLNTEGTFAA